MVFKFILNLFKAFLLVTLLSHCGLYIKDVYKDIPLEDTNLGCLNGLGSKFNNYLQKDIPQKEIGEVASCLKSAVTIFKEHVRGKTADTYEPEELRDFLQEFFLKDKKIPRKFLNSLMELKVALVGGDLELLTKAELEQIIVKIDLLEKFISDMYPHIDIFYSRKSSDYRQVQQGISQLKLSLKNLSGNLFAQPYSLNSVLKLLEQSNEVFNFSEGNNFYWFKLFKESAPFLLNSSQFKDIINEFEWDYLLDMAADALAIYFYKIHGDQAEDFQDTIRNYSLAIENLIQFLDKKISKARTKSLSTDDVKDFINHLDDKELLPISIFYVDSFLKNMFSWFLENPNTQDNSLDMEELNWWRKRYFSWKQTQNSIDFLKVWMTNNPSYSIQDIFRGNISLSKSFNESLGQIYSLYNSQDLYNEEHRSDLNIYYTYPSTSLTGVRHKNLTLHNLYSHLWSVAMSRYAKSHPLSGLTEEELGQIIDRVITLLQLFKGQTFQSKLNYGNLAFMISNIILYSTEGYYQPHYYRDSGGKTDILSTAEGIELLSLYFQAQRSANDFSQFLLSNCSAINENCFKKYITQYILEKMYYTPHLQDFIQQLRDTYLVNYVDSLAQLLRIAGPIDDIKRKQIESVFYGIFFQEVMFTRFDKNQNGSIEQDGEYSEFFGGEDSVFHLWKGFLEHGQRNIMCYEKESSENQLKFFFFYVIRNKQPIDMTSGKGMFDVGLNYMISFFSNKMEMTRVEMMELLVNLSAKLKSNSSLSQSCQK